MQKLLISLSVLSLSLMACGGGEESDSAEDADESAVVTSSESALTSELSDEVSQPMSASANDIAAAAAARVNGHLTPAGCLTKTVSGATVTYVFNDCTGPYGLVHVTGTVTAVYSRPAGGGVQAVISGTGVKVNGAVVDIDSTVKASQANGIRKADVVSNATGTGPRGNSLAREGSYTVTYDPTAECVTVDGTWSTNVSGRANKGAATASTVVSGYKRCKGQCPAAGGKIVHTGLRNVVVTLTYDGTANASYSSTAGKSGTVTLQCGK